MSSTDGTFTIERDTDTYTDEIRYFTYNSVGTFSNVSESST